MDELDLLLKEACMKVAEMEVEQWENDVKEHTFSERFNQKMAETFPFLLKSLCQKVNKSPE